MGGPSGPRLAGGRNFRRTIQDGSSEVRLADLFDCEATWRKERGPGGDDQVAVGASERGAESLEGVPVRLGGGRLGGEVVDEGRAFLSPPPWVGLQK